MYELKNKILLKKFEIIKRIGKGAFGSVYLGKNINNDEYVAIKLELKNQTDTILEREAYILHILRGFGIPQVISYGNNKKYNILIQELLGKSLDKLLLKKNKKLSLKDSCMVGIQILDRLEYIHNKNIIHRDIKADNFLIGLKKNEIIYIIDFGLAKRFRSSKTGKHVKYCINKKWSGTSRFASANTLRGIESSRRDDMESFCYLLLYLMKGTLPWDKLKETSEINEILIIYKMKQYMPADIMFKELPSQMSDFYKYCKSLNFEQKPNYNYLRKLLINILEYIGEKNDLYFSWIINISLNKSKSGITKKYKQINRNNTYLNKYQKIIYNYTNVNSKKKERKIELKNINSNKYKHLKKIKSSENINKANENVSDLKKHILGYCNIMKKKYLKSQSPNIRKVITKNERIKKKIDNKNNIVIDLTDYIENKKANKIKSYKSKLFNYKKNEKLIKTELKNNNRKINSLTERKKEKQTKNISNKYYYLVKPILKVSTYSINNLSSLKIKNNNLSKNNISELYLDKKELSPIISKKRNKLNLFEITNNGGNHLISENIIRSNSFIKELQLTNINNRNIDKDKLYFMFPKKKRTFFNCNEHKYKNIIENRSIIYNKKLLASNPGFSNKINQNSEIIKHKLTDNGIFDFCSRENNIS